MLIRYSGERRSKAYGCAVDSYQSLERLDEKVDRYHPLMNEAEYKAP